ncbi:hypothetical protein CDO73_26240 [Saccharibacillus sp. O23]|uniref:hypothetical protein n=1 Tax=Saccharibacillus sp. O23 TaxID=2009338 RepID=UPI000B40C5DD|nr:hypothetical protein [Saccharibacillus sp. O23]OWA33047.1 hypothetical protein B9G55_23910 [Saccharibacillus sp. O16]OWR25680.1 hypothetical protein CDO73_26240 [Saccharibacillus sp. O23]
MEKLDRTETERLNRFLRSIYRDIRMAKLDKAKEKIEQLGVSIDAMIEQREEQADDQGQS